MSSSSSSSESCEDIIEHIDMIMNDVCRFRGVVQKLFSDVNPHNRSFMSVSTPLTAGYSETPVVRNQISTLLQSAKLHLDIIKNIDARLKQKKTPIRTILLGEPDRSGMDKMKSKIDASLHSISKHLEKKRFKTYDVEESDEFEPQKKEKTLVSPSSKIQKMLSREESSFKDCGEILTELKTGRAREFFSVMDLVKMIKTSDNCSSAYIKLADLFIVNIILKDNVPLQATVFSVDEPIFDISTSRHKINRQISKICCQALDYYRSHPVYKNYPFQAFMIYFAHYRRFMTEKCAYCETIMAPPNIMEIPFFRDFETTKPYHMHHIPVTRRFDLGLPGTEEYRPKDSIKKTSATSSSDINTPMSVSATQTPLPSSSSKMDVTSGVEE
ncbi:hypothetical protein C9374_002126 [Naegleria lovaniensis]|uniref:Uncharacterized protein n=1 Tax=Naegleria lovaniensis TaxID=51637 RepID=A0AA88GRI9_NAELO|nr:uncharacterized protein C9374_002126 [Naegleria lovaniensis]KAG2387091.1 hypothetical protein C9374_002126 [Naegleria lovaniensis]